MKLITNLRADGVMNVGGLTLAPSGGAFVQCLNDELTDAVSAGAISVADSAVLTETDDVMLRGWAGKNRYNVGVKVADIVRAASGQGAPVTLGTVPAGVTAVESGFGSYRKTTLTLATTLGAIAGGASLGLGKLVYTLPAGAQIIQGSYMSVAITQTQGNINADTPVVGLGSVVASGAVAVLSGTATFQDVLAGVATANCTGTAKVSTFLPTVASGTTRNTGGTKTIYLNVAYGWAASGDAAAILTGTIVLNWMAMA